MIEYNKILNRIKISTSDNVIKHVVKAMESGFYAKGPHLQELQNVLINRFNKKYAILTTNGFSSLFITLKALNLPKNHHVSTASAATCFAMVNAIKAANLVPKFVDLEKNTLSLQTKMIPSNKSKKNVLIIPDHFGLISNRVKNKLKNEFIIEDASQSFMSRSSINTSSDVLILSFYPTKWVNGIDGGAILTDNSTLASKLKEIVTYVDQVKQEQTTRYNMTMSNIHAACVLGSLNGLDTISKKLIKNYKLLSDYLNETSLKYISIRKKEIPSRFICLAKNQRQRNSIIKEMRTENIDASKELVWITNHRDKALFPTAKKLITRTFSIPFHPYLTIKDINKMKTFFNRFI